MANIAPLAHEGGGATPIGNKRPQGREHLKSSTHHLKSSRGLIINNRHYVGTESLCIVGRKQEKAKLMGQNVANSSAG